MASSPLHGSGIIIMTACGNDRPLRTSISRALSNMAESLPAWSMIGKILAMSGPNNLDWNMLWRAVIQLTLPRSVLISPLWARYRYGWARAQLGNVLVLKREWTIARAVSTAWSTRSG